MWPACRTREQGNEEPSSPLHWFVPLQGEVEPLQRMFDKFINKILAFKKDNCNELVPVPEYSGIISLCKLYSALATPENGVRTTSHTHTH